MKASPPVVPLSPGAGGTASLPQAREPGAPAFVTPAFVLQASAACAAPLQAPRAARPFSRPAAPESHGPHHKPPNARNEALQQRIRHMESMLSRDAHWVKALIQTAASHGGAAELAAALKARPGLIGQDEMVEMAVCGLAEPFATALRQRPDLVDKRLVERLNAEDCKPRFGELALQAQRAAGAM